MIREFDNKDVNDVIDLAMSHCEENGTGFGKYDEHELITLIRKIKIAPDFHGLVYVENGKVIGYAACQSQWNPWNRYKEGILQYFYIHPSFRNGFKSKSLLEQCQRWFEEQECDYFIATTMAFNNDFQVDDVNEDFLTKAEGFFGRQMTNAGSYFVKGLN